MSYNELQYEMFPLFVFSLLFLIQRPTCVYELMNMILKLFYEAMQP